MYRPLQLDPLPQPLQLKPSPLHKFSPLRALCYLLALVWYSSATGTRIARFLAFLLLLSSPLWFPKLHPSAPFRNSTTTHQSPLSDPDPLVQLPPYDLSPPTLLPNDCKKTLLIKLRNNSGFFSEMGVYARFAARARSKGYTILVDDSGWNCGKLTDYFDHHPPACASHPSILTVQREEYCQGDSLVESPHMVVDRWCYELLDQVMDLEANPQVTIEQDVWTYLNMHTTPTTLPFGQTLHPGLKDEFVGQSNELRAIWKPNQKLEEMLSQLEHSMRPSLDLATGKVNNPSSKLISIHYRLGDKASENSWDRAGSQVIGIEPAFRKPNRFLEKALAMAQLHHWHLGPQNVKVVIASDNMDEAMKGMSEYHNLLPNPPPFQLMPLNETSFKSHSGHDQTSFDQKPLEFRISEARSCVVQVEWMRRNSDAIVCSGVSNVCAGLMLLVGADRVLHQKHRPCSVASVDGRWTPRAIPSRRMVDPNDASLPRLAKELLDNPNNTIDFNVPFYTTT